MLKSFQKAHPISFNAACFGVAGPLEGGVVKTTNLDWTFSAIDISDFLNIEQTWLINDLEAIAYGIELLAPSEVLEITPQITPPHQGNQAVIAPGSGIGEAILYWDGSQHRPFATEGGHCSFSPSNALQTELLKFLFKKFKYVSWEKLLSGPGLANIYHFMEATYPDKKSPALADKLRTGDPSLSARITHLALTTQDDLCLKTIELFFEILANEAGNLALKSLPSGGLFIAGGITPKLLPLLDKEKFSRDFLHKDGMTELLAKIPIYLVLNDEIGILGAARYALLQKNNLGRLKRP